MKHGDLVALRGQRRRWVALQVSAADLRRGIDVARPGLYLFTGYWYGGQPLSHRSYGKVVEVLPGARAVGRVGSAYAARRHCR